MASGMALTFYFLFQDLPSITERRPFGNAKDLPLFFGTAIFAFEGIALVSGVSFDIDKFVPSICYIVCLIFGFHFFRFYH